MEGFHGQTLEHELRLGTFMRTGDAKVIEGAGFPHIPSPDSGLIISTLSDAQVQIFLPAPLRREFVRDRQPYLLPAVQDGPLSFAAIRIPRYGRWIAAGGAAMLLAVFFRMCSMWHPGALLKYRLRHSEPAPAN
jgi:hypothetical protein